MVKSVRVKGGRRFTVALRPEDDGMLRPGPELPQAISRGESKAEALANIREAIELVLDHLKAREAVIAANNRLASG